MADPTILASGSNGLALSHTIPAAGTITPAADKLILIAYRTVIGAGTPAVPAATGCGLTFEEPTGASVLSGTARIGWLMAMGAAANGTIAVTFATAQSLRYVVLEVPDAMAPGANGANAVRNVAAGASDAVSPLGPINYAAFSNAANAAIAVGGLSGGSGGTHTPRSGWSELYDDGAALTAAYKSSSDAAWEFAFTGSALAGVGLELVRDGAPPPPVLREREILPQPMQQAGYLACTLTVQPVIVAALSGQGSLVCVLAVQPALVATLAGAGELAAQLAIIPPLIGAISGEASLGCKLDIIPRTVARPGDATSASQKESTITEAGRV